MSGKYSEMAKRLSVNGILLALTVITLLAVNLMPTNKLSLYALSSFYISVIIIEFGIKSGWMFYTASCILSFITGRFAIPYILFFGIYGILKYYAERIKMPVFEYMVKIGYFNLVSVLAFVFARQFLPELMNFDYKWWVVLIALEAIFLLYDYVFTLFIQYYNNKLRNKLRIYR